MPPKPTKPCGTYPAYMRHMRAKEKACDPCKAAQAREVAKYRAKKKQEKLVK